MLIRLGDAIYCIAAVCAVLWLGVGIWVYYVDPNPLQAKEQRRLRQCSVAQSDRALLSRCALWYEFGALHIGSPAHLVTSAGRPPSARGWNASSPRMVAVGFTRSHSPFHSAGVLTWTR